MIATTFAIPTAIELGDLSGCGGEIDGEMKMAGNIGTLVVENADYDPEMGGPMFGHQYCEINLTFTEDGFLVVEEKEGCLTFHGAACTFSGTLNHQDTAGKPQWRGSSIKSLAGRLIVGRSLGDMSNL